MTLGAESHGPHGYLYRQLVEISMAKDSRSLRSVTPAFHRSAHRRHAHFGVRAAAMALMLAMKGMNISDKSLVGTAPAVAGVPALNGGSG